MSKRKQLDWIKLEHPARLISQGTIVSLDPFVVVENPDCPIGTVLFIDKYGKVVGKIENLKIEK